MVANRISTFQRCLRFLMGAPLVLQLGLLMAPLALADDHRVLWQFRVDGYDALGRRVDIGPDGTLYTSTFDRLYALSPAGDLLWTVEGVGGGRPVTFGADGTIYTGAGLVTAINPDGTIKWQFANPRPGLDLAAGPNIGPDGNIYAAQDTDSDPAALGVFSLDPDGNLLWSTGMDYPMIGLRGPSYTDILFDTDRMYITIYRRLSRPPTIRTYDYDGDLLWYSGDLGLAIGGPPELHPNGSLIFNWAQIGLQSLTKDGDIEWISEHPGDGSLLLAPDIAADGTIYVGDWLGSDWWNIDPDGNTLWFGPSTGEMLGDFGLTPDVAQIVAGGSDTFGVPGWVRGYDANANGARLWTIDLPDENGLNQRAGRMGTFSTDGQTAYFVTGFPSDANYGYVYAVDLSLDLDCDADDVLDINDNCVCEFNPGQIDFDGDGIGDACDPFTQPDNCVDAIALCPGSVVGNTIGATNDGLSSCSPFPDQNLDVWYSYTPAGDSTVTIDGCGSAYSFYLSVHTGCPGTGANEIACNSDGCSGLWPTVTFDAIGGQTYFIRVNGFSAVEIDYVLTLTGGDCGPRPPIATDSAVTAIANTPVSITLGGTDDGLPAPPQLDCVITSLPAAGTLSDPGAGSITNAPYTLVGGGNEVVYEPDAWVMGPDSFQFKLNDGGTAPTGGDSNLATVSIQVNASEPIKIFDFPLDSNPGWSTEGQWDFGAPTGGGSHNFDPTSGHTGTNVYGYNLAGDYTDLMSATHLTTTALDLTGMSDVELRFWRWLGVEISDFDHASVEVSTDGANWTQIWDHNGSTISDAAWSQMVFDISSIADGEATVFIRWVMGATDASITYPGWNIDDIEIFAVSPLTQKLGDVDGDGDVDIADLGMLLANFGCAAGCSGDADGDGDTDITDLGIVLANFGQ